MFGGAVGSNVGPVVVGDGVVGFSVESLMVRSLVGGEFFLNKCYNNVFYITCPLGILPPSSPGNSNRVAV